MTMAQKITFNAMWYSPLNRLAWKVFRQLAERYWGTNVRLLTGYTLICGSAGGGKFRRSSASKCPSTPGVEEIAQSIWNDATTEYTGFDPPPYVIVQTFLSLSLTAPLTRYRIWNAGTFQRNPSYPWPNADMQHYSPLLDVPVNPLLPMLDAMHQPIFKPMPTPMPLPPTLARFRDQTKPEGSMRDNGPRHSRLRHSRQRMRDTMWLEPPRGRWKERKFHPTRAGMQLHRLMELLTESLDFLEATWHALPGKSDKAAPPAKKMLRDVLLNLDKITWTDFMREQAKEYLGDKAWGELNKQGSGDPQISGAKRGIGIILRDYL